ncbi:MarR family transcriptional regulator [Prauserella sp. PE36]|uniref:MarR family winged helix-turn-helix transcriptional regulator n=1 Tax=Prauserella sp. PE36 TaxID=1504709 RepID=UPI000DA0F1B5|nr:MarR family winged helix-turn-helix transcriptional regulator [Prauserella sp. PE36]PXY34635.1 MarR family transcriptional regulator [Prauserella coralliicola]RBM12913.1 MarR family transcriptional regulator [Prauserella sp. PE36]
MNPSDEVCVDLMRQIRTSSQLHQAWVMQLWQTGDGPHPAAVMLLSEIDRQGELRLSELAKLRMVDISVVSRQIGQLASFDLVERRPSPEDGRVTLVKVSEKGQRHLERWRRLHVDFVRNALAGWDESELEDLAHRLRAVNDDLRAMVSAQARNQERPATRNGTG